MALQYIQGGKSSVIFGYETGGTIVTANASMIQRAYAFNNWNVNEVEAPEENAALRDSLDGPFPEDGLLSAAGSSELPMALSGMLPIFQLATGDETPVSTAQADKVIVAAATDVSDVVMADFFTAAATKAARNPAVGEPSKLHFELSDPNVSGFIVIRGLRRTGVSTSDDSLLLQEETVTLDTTGQDATSTKHFHEILDIGFLTSAGVAFTTGTITITAEPDGYSTVFELNDDEPTRLTVEAELAEVPVRYYGMLASQVVFNLGTPNSIGIDWLGTRMDEERTIAGGHTRQLIGNGTRVQNPTVFPFVTRRILPSWGGYLVLDDQALLFEGMTLTFNHGWEFSTGHHAERFQDDVERQTRVIGASFNVYAQFGTASGDIYTRWQEKFRERTGSPVEASAFHFPSSGRQYELKTEMPNMLLNAPVPLNISDRGRVQRTVEATAFRTDTATTSDNAVVTYIGEDSF
jgi:hypothetical protein